MYEDKKPLIGIYKITSPIGKVYIGQSTDIENRKKAYEKGACKNQTKLYHSILKYGFDNHKFEIIELCCEQDLNLVERSWQDYFCVMEQTEGLNLRLTKSNDRSGTVSEETRKKISNTLKGRKKSAITRARMSAAKRGTKHSKPQSAEHRRKIIESRKRNRVERILP